MITFVAEPLLEALPQIYILIGVLTDKSCKEQKGITLCLENILTGNDNSLYMLTLISSIFTAAFGITKFLKLGPCRFLPSKGCLGGYFTCSFVLVMMNVVLNIIGPPILLRLLYGLDSFLLSRNDVGLRIRDVFTMYFPLISLKILGVSNPYFPQFSY